MRADRQPEFTQLDIEMSFIKECDIQASIEQLIEAHVEKDFNIDLLTPFARMTYDEAFAFYGSDKPDFRFGLKIHDCTPLFEHTDIKFLRAVTDAGGKIGALVYKIIHFRVLN